MTGGTTVEPNATPGDGPVPRPDGRTSLRPGGPRPDDGLAPRPDDAGGPRPDEGTRRVRATWLVTNGRAVIGPVSTAGLLRAMERGVVGPDCLVRQPGWSAWRQLAQIREVGTWFRQEPPAHAEIELWLGRASDLAELAHLAMVAALRATRASFGRAYLRGEGGYVALCAEGGNPEDALGRLLEPSDPAFGWAARGESFLGDVRSGAPACLSMAQRFPEGEALCGVASIPLLAERRLLGVVELARTDHPFRESDRELFERIAWGVRLRSG